MNKREKEIATMVSDAGLLLVSSMETKASRIRFMVEAPNGKRGEFRASERDGDRVGNMNFMSELKRFKRENPATAFTEALKESWTKAGARGIPQPTEAPKVFEIGTPKVTMTSPHVIDEPKGMVVPPVRTATTSLSKDLLTLPVLEKQLQDVNQEIQKHESKEMADKPKGTANARTKAPGSSNRVLTQMEFFRVCEWLKTQDVSNIKTYIQLTKLAEIALSIKMAPTAVQRALEVTGIALPMLEKRTPPTATEAQLIIAKSLAKLIRDLGMEPDADLLSIIKD